MYRPRSLGAHRSAEADRECACHQGGNRIMLLDLGFVLGYGYQHFRDAMTDVVLDDISYDQQTQQHSDTRENQVGPCRTARQGGKAAVDSMDRHFEENGGNSAQQAGHHREYQETCPLRKFTQKGPKRAPYVSHSGILHYYSSSDAPAYWEMLSSGRVSPAASEASALPPATASFSASSSPSSQRSTSSRSSVLTLIFTR